VPPPLIDTPTETVTPTPTETPTETVTPTPKPSPVVTATLRGLTLTVTGNGWVAGERLRISLSSSDSMSDTVLLARPYATRKGTFLFVTVLRSAPDSTATVIVAGSKATVTVPIKFITPVSLRYVTETDIPFSMPDRVMDSGWAADFDSFAFSPVR
jgi:hypothetical protein